MAGALLWSPTRMSDPDSKNEALTELITIPLEDDEDDDFAEAPTLPIPLHELPSSMAQNRGKVRRQDGREKKKEDPSSPR